MLSPKRSFFLLWIAGFFLWLGFDLLMEAVVFEYLKWNGTTKNDPFFIFWWLGGLTWTGYGIRRLLKTESLQ